MTQNGRQLLFEHVMEPGTGKAVPVLRGQILRLEQIGNGQCADFNAYNLHDYKEHFHCGRTRVVHGLWPTLGDSLWSAPPRDREMLTIIADSVGTNDVNYPRCNGVLYESMFGFERHTSCQDIQAEAQREYGLTPDDVHDSFNFWMHTGVDMQGRLSIKPMRARRGDYIELIAHMDVLAIPNVCGADVTMTSNFGFKPVKIQIWSASDADRGEWLRPEARVYKNQRDPSQFRLSDIKVTRELSPDPGYQPEWPVYPIREEQIEVPLSVDDNSFVEALRHRGDYGVDDGEIIRSVFFHWWLENQLKGAGSHTHRVT